MKTRRYNSLKSQRGVAALFTAIVLLICITVVALFTSKTVVMETKMTADDYRTSQATAAATAAMDQAVLYFMNGGLRDEKKILSGAVVVGTDGSLDFTNVTPLEPTVNNCAIPTPTAAATTAYNITLPLTPVANTQTTYAQFYFSNAAAGVCNIPTGTPPVNNALVTAKGWSDDCEAVRTITQCIGTFMPFPTTGPKQPFVTAGSIGIAGNATFINRYTNTNVWTGGALTVPNASFGTYLRPPNVQVADLTKYQLMQDCNGDPADPSVSPAPTNPPGCNTSSGGIDHLRLVSNRNAGYGLDVSGNDPNLGNLTPDQLWALFFGDITRAALEASASEAGQRVVGTDVPTLTTGMAGTVWAEGNVSMSGTNTIGSPTAPVMLIVHGNFDLGGGKIYGVVYVTGTVNITGSPTMYGSLVSESGTSTGNGSPTIVFVPWFDGSGPPDKTNTTTLPGSWRDW